MSNYTKTTNFATKDTLASGNPLKTIKGTEFNVEFDAIAVASATKANLAAPTFTGVVSAVTASSGTDTTQVATTAFVATAVSNVDLSSLLPKAGGAMTGAITTNSTFDGVDIAVRDSVLSTTTTTADAALPKAGGALTGAVTTNSTFDGVDIAVRDAVLTTTATVALEALPKAGGAMTGAITTNSTFDGRDVAADGATADAALPKAGGTLSGTVVAADNIIQRPVLKDYGETKVAMAANEVDLELGNVHTKTISGSQTLTFANPPASGTAGAFTLILTNGGSATVTWPSSVDWPVATAPTLTAAGIDILTFVTCDGGTTWYGVASGIGMA